jgi:hypothetical protein
VGALITGAGIPAGTTINAVSSTGGSATLSQPASSNESGDSITINRTTELGPEGECAEFGQSDAQSFSGTPLANACSTFIGGEFASDANTITGNLLSGAELGAIAIGPGSPSPAWNGPVLSADPTLNANWYAEDADNTFGGPPGAANGWSGNTLAEADDGSFSGFNSSPTLLNTWGSNNYGNNGDSPCDPSASFHGETENC